MAAKKPVITVAGSLNMDLTAYVETLPQPGQTLSSKKFVVSPGGKGANQAVAASRLGAVVSMYGCIGMDSYGQQLVQSLQQSEVLVENVASVEENTGLALILVEDSSENEIVVVPGANHGFTTDVWRQMDHSFLKRSDTLLLQHEIPMETLEQIARDAHHAGVRAILNPAPARKLSADLLACIEILIPNQTELAQIQADGFSMNDLFSLGIQAILETRGKDGVFIYTKHDTQHVEGLTVDAIDAVGAGDTFVAAFAVAYSAGADVLKAARYANCAAALSTTRSGAQASFPYAEEITNLGVSYS
ncbi:ribokinase [Fodinisporobacter ferrooxydans]|uniref:Ribokinase n=1 Tax=Fodinisporobacter ferrooxydans TaxID=2901836 RepID=A0ABY4CDN5_9BACL|nr:ribokinase [Alicyclobacillaceae bacterium MYW30-H2]